jgi:alpha-1,3-rhamnosyl/mannosyltransferase
MVNFDRTDGEHTLRVALFFDMDGCYAPTGVTRHALAQLSGLAKRPEIELTAITGRLKHPDGLAYWESLEGMNRRELPVRTRDALRWWRLKPWPPIDWWARGVDWIYCPSEYFVVTEKAKLAVTSHDVLQLLSIGGQAKRDQLARIFGRADRILSVSHFNTDRLCEAFAGCEGKVAYVPNGAEDLFYSPATEMERSRVRGDLGLPPGVPYLVSVANFQARKNLERLIQAALLQPEVVAGDLALVFIGTGAEEEAERMRTMVAAAGRKALIRLPGYRQGRDLRAIYAEARALVFPSRCESFGIPAVEAMAQGLPVVLANSTALPEVAGEAGWYCDPLDEASIADAIRRMLDEHEERARRVEIGKGQAAGYRWERSTELLVEALTRQGKSMR